MTDINLDQMRQDIDNIDEKLTDLFKERMEKSLEIAKYKKGHKVPVFSDKREKEILHKVSEQIGEPFDGYARLLFNTIFDASRSCQNNYMAKRSDLADRIEEALKETNYLNSISPAILQRHPEVLPILRMSTCPPIARDRLIGLAGVSKNLVQKYGGF